MPEQQHAMVLAKICLCQSPPFSSLHAFPDASADAPCKRTTPWEWEEEREREVEEETHGGALGHWHCWKDEILFEGIGIRTYPQRCRRLSFLGGHQEQRRPYSISSLTATSGDDRDTSCEEGISDPRPQAAATSISYVQDMAVC